MSSTPTRTVVVTGANSATGRDLLLRLARPDVRVIALVRTPEELPADEAEGDLAHERGGSPGRPR